MKGRMRIGIALVIVMTALVAIGVAALAQQDKPAAPGAMQPGMTRSSSKSQAGSW
jgi:hypothetical protein